MKIQITVPYLIYSKSNNYKMYRRGVIVKPEVKAQQDTLSQLFRNEMNGQNPTQSNIRIDLYVQYGDKRRRDLDGHLKLLLDAMNEIIFVDDKQVIEIHCYKTYLKGKPETTVIVTEI